MSEKPLVVIPDQVPQEAREFDVENRVHVGFLKLSDEDRQTLQAPIPLEDLDILPSGEVYASQIQYRRRLNQVFGPGGWKLVERSEPRVQEQSVIQKWELVCLGISISVCWGEQDRVGRQTWATAIESAKSNGLTRCCKDLGIASECWDRRYTEWFKKEHCVQVRTQSGSAWRRKDRDPLYNEIRQSPQLESGAGASKQAETAIPPKARAPKQPAPPPSPSPKVNAELIADLMKKIHDAESDPLAIVEYYKVATLEDLTQDQYDHCMKTLNTKLIQNQQKGLKLD